MTVMIFDNPEELGVAATKRFEESYRSAVLARGRLTWALTGGSGAEACYSKIARTNVDWERVHLFWGDERAVSPDAPGSNFRLAREMFIDQIDIPKSNVHRMRAEITDLDAAVTSYAQELRDLLGQIPEIDLVHLGMGPEGHVCSLFPDHGLLTEREKLVAIIRDSPKPPPIRLTLTLPVVNRARECLFLVMGQKKAEAVRDAIENPKSEIPAAIVARNCNNPVWLLDRGAASLLEQARRVA